MSARPPTPIGPAQAALMAGPVSIIVGSRDAALRPHLMRAVGCRLDEERRRVTVLMSARAAARAAARCSPTCAPTGWWPSCSASRRATARCRSRAATPPWAPATPTTPRTPSATCAASSTRSATSALRPWSRTRCSRIRATWCAVRFTVDETFEQTPGPSAGEPLPPQR